MGTRGSLLFARFREIFVPRMRKLRIALSLGMIVLLTGLGLWLSTRFESPNVPQQITFSSLADLREPEESATSYEATRPLEESPADALTAVSTQVFSCDEQTKTDEPARSAERMEEIQASEIQKRIEVGISLRNSKDPEHLLIAALIGSDRQSKRHLTAMENALMADPDNRLTLWNFLATCSLHAEATVCADGIIERRAISVDSGNGQLWGKIAGYRLDRGDNASAYDALLKANTAPYFNGYFIEHVEMAERGFAAATDDPYVERVMRAIGIAAGMSINVAVIFQGCEKQAMESAEWRQACLEYGKRLENDGRDLLQISIGISLQKIMYEISGDKRKIAETELRYQHFKDTTSKLARSNDAQVLTLYDENVLADFIAEWSAHGELRAAQFVQEEVIRLSKQPGYDPCMLSTTKENTADD